MEAKQAALTRLKSNVPSMGLYLRFSQPFTLLKSCKRDIVSERNSPKKKPENDLTEAPPLDGPAFSPDRLTVRGRDLNDLVGSLSYPAAVYHLLTGELPS